jgi:single-stranded DNA-binding protein
MNCAIVSGALSRDPKSGKGPSGKTWCFFSVAAKGFRDSVDYISVKAFGEAADTVAAMSAGMPIEVVGRLGSEKPKDDGSKEWKMVVIADRVTTPAGTSGGGTHGTRRPASERTRESRPEDMPASSYVPPPANDDDSLPF